MITKKVSCPARIKDIEEAAKNVKEVDVGDGWVETNDNMKVEEEECFDLDDAAHVVEEKKDAAAEEEECFDLDDLEAEEKATDNIFASKNYVVKNDDGQIETGIVTNAKMRKYDLSITYDYYH